MTTLKWNILSAETVRMEMRFVLYIGSKITERIILYFSLEYLLFWKVLYFINGPSFTLKLRHYSVRSKSINMSAGLKIFCENVQAEVASKYFI